MKKPLRAAHAPNNAATANMLTKFYPLLLLLMLVWLAWTVARLIWLVLAPPVIPNLPPVALQPSNSAPMSSNALDIFAQPTMPTPEQTTPEPPPDIKVLGVTVANPARLSFAILNAGGKTQSVRVGDPIGDTDYKLFAVHADHIVLLAANGQQIEVKFGEPFDLDQSDAIRAKQSEAGSNSLLPPPPSLSDAMSANTAPSGDPDHERERDDPSEPASSNNPVAAAPSETGARKALTGAINNLEQNPAAYLSQMGVAATGEGYLVTDGTPAGLKSRLGLQTGDRVVSVNGQNVGVSPQQDAELLKQVRQSGNAQIQVQRGDQVITVRQSF